MRAVELARYGEASELRLARVPPPEPKPRQLLVRVHAAAVNPVDCKIRKGTHRAVIRPALPVTLGMDLSGVVERVGRDVTRFAVGDEVFASPNHRTMGSYAELAVVDEAELAPKPQNLTHQQAASLPLVALTAWDALIRHGRVQRGERVLVQAGAGGVGTIAIQLAKWLGAEVLATCSAPNAELVSSLGADEVIDYRSERYEERARGVDAIVESLGPEHLLRALHTVRRGGRILALTTGLPEAVDRFGPWLGVLSASTRLAGFVIRARLSRNVRVRPLSRKPCGQTLAEIGTLVENGQLRPVIDSVFSLEDAAAAHRRVESGRSRGKVVLAVA